MLAFRVLPLALLAVLLIACDSGTIPTTPIPLLPTPIPLSTSTVPPNNVPVPSNTPLATDTLQPTSTSLPTSTSAPPTPTDTVVPLPAPTDTALPPTIAPATQEIDSGGLGLSVSKWEAMHGAPSGKGIIGTYYEDKRFEIVAFDGPIEQIYVTYGDDFPISVEDAKFISGLLLPKDATLVKAQTLPDTGSTVYSEVYHSASLAAVIDALPPMEGTRGRWRGAGSGIFEVRMRAYDSLENRVPQFSIALGKDE